MEKPDYLILVQAPGFVISENEFAIESAFAEHLRILRRKTKHRFQRIVLAAPQLDKAYYDQNKSHLATIHSEECIFFLPLHLTNVGTANFWLFNSIPIIRILWKQIKKTALVHTGLSSDIWKPILFFSTVCAKLQDKKSLWVTDIDFRRSAWMMYKSGIWSFKSYLLCRYIYDYIRVAQIKYAVRNCSLVLLKGHKMVADFSKGWKHVRNFYNTAHSEKHILTQSDLKDKIIRLNNFHPLRFVYFGRLVEYKGIDLSIRAVNAARKMSGRRFEFHIIGTGDKKQDLQKLVKELNAESETFFHNPMPYGPSLFNELKQYDMCLATPISEDTPRAAFDGMAIGLPYLAFDIQYYQDLHRASGAVEVTQWPNIELLTKRIIELDNDRDEIAKMIENGVDFALKNTQDIWLERRLKWTFNTLDGIEPLDADNHLSI